MRNPGVVEDQAFLHAEARELATLAEEHVAAGHAARRRPASVLHTLAVELSILKGLGDSPRIDWLVGEASRLLAEKGEHEAIAALRDTLSRVR